MSIASKITALREELREHNHNYYVLDNPTISDYDFDIKLKELQKLEEEHPEFHDPSSPTLRVGGAVTKNFETPMSKRDRVIRNLGEGTVEQKGRELEGRCEQSS